jgi:hypothetical protein
MSSRLCRTRNKATLLLGSYLVPLSCDMEDSFEGLDEYLSSAIILCRAEGAIQMEAIRAVNQGSTRDKSVRDM